ncbi:transcriptional regulator [Bacillus sp. V3-13]|nr:transcriptional regulator [Bacillus sp. V3-13]
MKNRIRELRKNKGLSQGDLAIKCNVSRQTINAIENDKYDPTLQLAFELAFSLNTTVDKLFLSDLKKERQSQCGEDPTFVTSPTVTDIG